MVAARFAGSTTDSDARVAIYLSAAGVPFLRSIFRAGAYHTPEHMQIFIYFWYVHAAIVRVEVYVCQCRARHQGYQYILGL